MTRKSRNAYYQGPPSDHFDGELFFNPGRPWNKGVADLIRWNFKRDGKESWPDTFPAPARDVPPRRVEGAGLRVTLIGHASFLIQTAGRNMLVDPVWSERASPFSFAGPKRVNPPGVAFDDLPRIDVVLVTHNHYDHLDVATLRRLAAAHRPRIVTPLGNDTIMREAGVGAEFEALDWGDVARLGDGLRVHAEPAQHWSARGLFDRRHALWAAFVIDGPGGAIYHVGDTGFHAPQFSEIRRKHGPPRLAILPIGAYEPRWFMREQHIDPDEAVRGFKLTGAARAVGHHWGTFKLTDEGIERPREALEAALRAHDVPAHRFVALRPGEVWTDEG
ncbi:MBL fold metallo-hydrolase [Alsobacter sp. SYSU M60028]|uniref:MBL fold metallo-hydrolase n=1 Tax=Alsobacter ponti TaxID=2962936 RepID=A0ABT1LHE2_9HYPH|nr:MBL fold metallo-hydrolase [Alsobacter ponti]MCP8940511.1 MBL fold metallo-hydrolase [Alsobacter ponti]